MTQESRQPSAKEIRQYQYEQGQRRLPEAPRSIGNYSIAGMIYRLFKRRNDRLQAGRAAMANPATGPSPDPTAPSDPATS